MILCADSTRRFPTPLLPTWIDTNVSLHSGPGVNSLVADRWNRLIFEVNCSVCFVKKHQHWLVVWNIFYVPKILVDHPEPTSE